MKKIFTLLFLSVLLLSCSKEPKPTELDLAITQQPNGGFNVSTLTCTFTASETGEAKPVIITTEWYWENGLHLGATLRLTNTYVVDGATQKAFTTTYTAISGYYFLNYLWVKLHWVDDTGAHMVETNKAYCN